MTDLTKSIVRRGTVPVHVIGRKRLVLGLDIGDVIWLRPEGKRRKFCITFTELYMEMARREAIATAAINKVRRNIKAFRKLRQA